MNPRPRKAPTGGAEWHCLSIRQPYAWAIIKGAKDVENRTWRLNYRGRLYIHAGLKPYPEDVVEDVVARVAKQLGIPLEDALSDYRQHAETARGAIIGSVTMFGCAVSHDSAWFEEGRFGFLLRDPEPFTKPIPAKGNRGKFTFKP